MAALELEKRSMILMPINDNASIDHAGGTHWYRPRTTSVHLLQVHCSHHSLCSCRTLLVYTRRDGKFRHYDSFSAQATVCTAAKRTAKVVPIHTHPSFAHAHALAS
jgi:hypothetical protein